MSAASACSIGLLCAVLSGGPLGETIPEKGPRRRAGARRDLSADEVYRLRGFVGYQIDLEFEHGESFVGLGAGDIEGSHSSAQDNHLFLKPKAGKIATNLTVLTTRRHYQFDYSSRPMSPGGEDPDVVFALRFIYPARMRRRTAAADAAKSAAAELESRLRDAAQGRPNNIDYWYCGSPTIKPIAAATTASTHACALPRSRNCPRSSCATTTAANRC
jgi:type IV secretion system protein VirB9